MSEDHSTPEAQTEYGKYECRACFHGFEDDIPVIYEDLPPCPDCGGDSEIVGVVLEEPPCPHCGAISSFHRPG